MGDSNWTSVSTKFKVAKVTECVVNDVANADDVTTKSPSICSQLKHYGSNHCTEVLMESKFFTNVRASRNNGFVRTVIECYNRHHNLVLRPDDIWTAILTQFSFYINKNAEEFRNQFVNFDGKKELVVAIDGSLRSAPYDLFVTKMTGKIDENLVDKTVKDWILPNFTTTITDDIIACGIVFMATTKKYFEYECMLLCGIPYITLEGTVADWENILQRLEKLKNYKLDKWYDMLKTILVEFIDAKKNKVNTEFWNRICHYLGGGSGPTFISGWLSAFAVFDEDGNWTDNSGYFKERLESAGVEWPVIDIDKIPSGIAVVDVKITEGKKSHESMMFAGHVGYEVLQDQCTLQPRIGWGIALKLTAEEVKKLHENSRSKLIIVLKG